jgi:hypothetical protein
LKERFMSVFTELVGTSDHPAQGTAATTESFDVCIAPFDGTLTEAAIIPLAALTAADTNFRTFTLQNRGQTGVGTTVMATLNTDVAGGNWVAHDQKNMALSGTAANLQFSVGDVLAIIETVGGTGATHPQMVMQLRGTHR